MRTVVEERDGFLEGHFVCMREGQFGDVLVLGAEIAVSLCGGLRFLWMDLSTLFLYLELMAGDYKLLY